MELGLQTGHTLEGADVEFNSAAEQKNRSQFPCSLMFERMTQILKVVTV